MTSPLQLKDLWWSLTRAQGFCVGRHVGSNPGVSPSIVSVMDETDTSADGHGLTQPSLEQ